MLDLIDHPLTGTPFGTALTVCVLIAAAAWLLSVVTREVSWVDRLWPICPPIYCLIVAAEADFASARINLMTVLAILVGCAAAPVRVPEGVSSVRGVLV